MLVGPGKHRRRRKWQWDSLVLAVQEFCILDSEHGCFLWQRGVDKDGYPRLYIDGRHWRGNRAILFAVTSEVNVMALHSCHQPRCLNPDHLRWGTASENAVDMWEAGRGSQNLKAFPGSSNPNAKLSDDDREEVVRRRLTGESNASVAAAFGISISTIQATMKGAGVSQPSGRPRH